MAGMAEVMEGEGRAAGARQRAEWGHRWSSGHGVCFAGRKKTGHVAGRGRPSDDASADASDVRKLGKS